MAFKIDTLYIMLQLQQMYRLYFNFISNVSHLHWPLEKYGTPGLEQQCSSRNLVVKRLYIYKSSVCLCG